MNVTLERFPSQVQLVWSFDFKSILPQAMYAEISREKSEAVGQRHGSPIGRKNLTTHSDLRLAENHVKFEWQADQGVSRKLDLSQNDGKGNVDFVLYFNRNAAIVWAECRRWSA